MDHDALETYLNDHLAGATLGADHARQLEAAFEGTQFGPVMTRIATEIEEDRDTLTALMERVDASRNAVKAATAWMAEKAGRLKFSGLSSGDADLGRYLALETLSLGVEGKRCLWVTLQTVADEHPALAELDLATLERRAEEQRAALEQQRLAMARKAFGAATQAGARG